MTDAFRWLIWRAVSSKPQTETDSLDDQLRDGRACVAHHGGVVVDDLCVDGHSREYYRVEQAACDVPAYRKLMEHCRARDFDVVWIRSWDRAGRTKFLCSDFEAYVTEASGRVYASDAPVSIDDRSANLAMMVNTIGQLRAQGEITEFRRRWRDGMTGKAAKGYVIGSAIAFGYRKVKFITPAEAADCQPLDDNPPPGGRNGKDLVIYHPEAAVVRMIYDWYEAGMSCRGIAARLLSEHIGGRSWQIYNVRTMLTNPHYAGYVRYSHKRHVTIDGVEKTIYQEPRVFCEGRHTAIITPEQFARVQALIEKRGHMRGRAAGSPFTFSGLLRCALCGGSMVGRREWRHPDRRFYRCHWTENAPGRCHGKSIREHRLVAMVRAWMQIMADAGYDAFSATLAAQSDTTDVIATLEAALRDTTRAVQLWDRQFERGKLSEAEWSEHRERLKQERDAITRRLAIATDDVRRRAATPTIADFRAVLATEDQAALRAFLLRFVDRIEWDGERVRVIPAR